jgi:uncharacterized membrane protein required for colicin V production
MDIIASVIGILFIIFLVRGAIRGFSGELAPLVGIIAFIGTLWYSYPPLQTLILRSYPTMDAGALVFYSALASTLLACLTFWLACALIKKVVRTIIPQPFNAILGALIGAIKVVLIVSVIGGLITVAQDRFQSLRKETEQNPFTAMVAQFWINRFQSLDFANLTSTDDAQTPLLTPTEGNP